VATTSGGKGVEVGKMRTALVTGSAGFLGRNFVPKLEAAGYAITGVDPRHDGGEILPMPDTYVIHYPGLHWCEFEWWKDFAPKQSYDVVVHLAAHIPDISERLNGGLHQYQDIALDWAVANYVKEHPPREAFIVPSSCAIDNPADPYAFVKITAERFCMELHKAGIPTVILRPFSGYGPDQADSYPFPAILKRALRQENPLTVWGDGHQVRDFIHIEDLTDAFLWAIEKAPRGIPIEIGTGVGTSFLEMARIMADVVGYSPLVCGDVSKPASSRKRIADTTLARKRGFEAKISLRDGIERAVKELSTQEVTQ